MVCQYINWLFSHYFSRCYPGEAVIEVICGRKKRRGHRKKPVGQPASKARKKQETRQLMGSGGHSPLWDTGFTLHSLKYLLKKQILKNMFILLPKGWNALGKVNPQICDRMRVMKRLSISQARWLGDARNYLWARNDSTGVANSVKVLLEKDKYCMTSSICAIWRSPGGENRVEWWKQGLGGGEAWEVLFNGTIN